MRHRMHFVFAVIAACALLSSCIGNGNPDEEITDPSRSYTEFTDLQEDEDGTVTILTGDIDRTAKYYNYSADGVLIQIVAICDDQGEAHIAFNTCQSCSPSPKAYYRQNGNVLQCVNCGFTFEAENVGITKGGCNPWPIDGVSYGEGKITIPVSSLKAMKSAFASWAGPIE